MTTLSMNPTLQFAAPPFTVYGIGPCSYLVKVEYLLTPYGEGQDDNCTPSSHHKTNLMGLTPDGNGKWKLFAGYEGSDKETPVFWDINKPTLLTAALEAWDEVSHSVYISCWDQWEAQVITLPTTF